MSRRFPVSLLFLPVLLGSCAERQDPIVADVGGKLITTAHLGRYLRVQPGWSQQQLDSAKTEALDYLIDEKLLALEAERMGYRDDEEILGRSPAEKKKAMVEHLYGGVVVERAEVGEWEVKRFYDRLAEEVKTRHILVENRKHADQIYADLTNGRMSFEELAKFTIDEETKGKGGDLGWLRWGGSTPKELQRVAFSLKVGETSKPFRTERGYHILRVDDRRGVERKPYEELRWRIRNWLKASRVEQLKTEYLDRMRKRARIHIYEEVLKILAHKIPKPEKAFLGVRRPRLPEVTPEEKQMMLASSILGEWTVGKMLEEAENSPSRYPSFQELDKVKDYIEHLITYELLVNQAEKLHLDRSLRVKSMVENQADAMMAAKLSSDTYVNAHGSDDELLEYYKTHLGYYTEPERVQAREILVETRQSAKEVLKELHRRADFAELAEARSIHSTREKGGDLGLFPRGRYPEIEEVAFALKPGEFSDIVETEDGFAIIKVSKRIAERIVPFDEAKVRVQDHFRIDAWEEWLETTVSRLRKETEVVINHNNLPVVGAETW